MYQPSITSCLSVSCQRDIIPIQPRRVQPAMGCEAFLLIGAWQVAASDSESARASVPWQLIPTAAVIPVRQPGPSHAAVRCGCPWLGFGGFLGCFALFRLQVILLLVGSSLSDTTSALQQISCVFLLGKVQCKPTAAIGLN